MPTNPAGKEFDDLSGEVVSGAGQIQQALQNIIRTAGEADSAHSELAEVQKKATKVAKDYADALDTADKVIGNMGKSTGLIASNAAAMGSGLGTAKKESAGLSKSLSGIAKHGSTATGNLIGVGHAAREASGHVASLRMESEMAASALGGIKGSVDITNLDKAITKVEELSTKISALGFDVKMNLDTSGVDTSVIDDLEKRLDDCVTVGVCVDTSDANKTKLEIDTSNWKRDLEAAKILFEETKKVAGGELKMRVDTKQQEAVEAYIATLSEAEKAATDVDAVMAKLATGTDAFSKTFQAAEKIVKNQMGLEAFSKNLSDSQKAFKSYFSSIESGRQKMNKGEFIEMTIKSAKLEKFIKILDEVSDPVEKAKIAGMELSDAMEYVSQNVAGAADEFANAALAAEELARSSSTLSGEIHKQGTALDIVIDKYNEGNKEAKSFASGVGVSGGKMIGAGVAAFFLFQKMGELLSQFKDAATGLAEFNTQTAATERGIAGIQYEGQLGDLREDVNLTREQYSKFIDVLEDGANSGVVSVNQLVTASKQLSDAFGGDQTERLKTYVDLLKSIPTLETDLSINASVDDHAAALFALAENGQVSAAIDLQSAGLLGGIKIDGGSDVDLLNSAQKTEKTMEGIKDTMLSFFPTWGPQFSAIATGVFAVAGAVGAVAAGVGTMAALMGTQLFAQNTTTAAVLSTGKGGGELPDGLTKKMKKLFDKGFKGAGGGFKGARAGLGNVVRGTASKGLLRIGPAASKAASGLAGVALPLAIFGMAATHFGGVLSDVKDDINEGSGDVSASLARLSGESLKAVGTVATYAAIGATIGSVIPVVGTAAGALAGAFIGAGKAVIDSGGAIGDALEDFGGDLQGKGIGLDGKEFDRYNGFVRGAGKAIGFFGFSMSHLDKDMKKFAKENNINTKSVLKNIALYGTGLGQLRDLTVGVIDVFKELSKTDAQKTEEANVKTEEGTAAKEMDNLRMASDKLKKQLTEKLKSDQANMKAFGAAMKGIAAAADSDKMKLIRFGVELDKTNLDIFSNVGGSVGAFERSIAGLSTSVSSEFDQINEAMAKQRKKILSDGTLQGQARKMALDKIHEQELAAVNRLVEGLDSVVEGLLNSPDIINAGLRDSIKGLETSFSLQGTVGSADIGANMSSNLDAALDNVAATMKTSNKIIREAAKTEEKLASERVKAEKALMESLKNGGAVRGVDVVKDDEGKATGIKVDADELAKGAQVLDSEIKKAKKSVDDISESLSGVVAVEAGANLNKTKLRLAELSDELIKSQAAVAETEKAVESADGDESDEAERNAAAAAKRHNRLLGEQKKLAEDKAKATSSLTAEISGLTDDAAEQASLLAYLETGYVAANLTGGRLTELLKGLGGVTGAQSGELDKWAAAMANLSGKIDQRANIEAVLNSVNGQNLSLEQYNKALGALVNANHEAVSRIQEQADAASQEAAASERALAMSESNLSLAKLKGDTAAALADKQKAENKYLIEQLKSTDEIIKSTDSQIKKVKEDIAAKKKLVAEGKKNLDTANASGDEALVKKHGRLLKTAEVGLNGAAAQLNALEGVQNEQVGKAASISESMIDISAKIGEGLDAFEGSVDGRQIAAELDLADALGEAAQFSDDFASITGKAFAITKKAAMADAKARIAAIESAAKTQKGNIQAQVDSGDLSKEKADVQFRTVAADTQARKAREETKAKERVVAAAEKEAGLARESISIREGVIDAEMSYLETVGGSLDAFAQLQNQSVGVEREKLAVAKEHLRKVQDSGVKGLKLRNAEADVIKQGFELRKKEFGVQKDIFDKIIGGVFGQIRSETGARRQRFSDIQKAGGVDKSRIKLPNGLLVGAGPGGVKTIDERRNERTTGGGGVRGAGVTDKAPDKKIEEELFGEAQANRAENAKSAAAVANMDKNSNTKGSLYVHDDGMHTRMDTLLSILQGFVGEMSAVTTAVGGPVEEVVASPSEVVDTETPEKMGMLVTSLDSLGEKIDKLSSEMNRESASNIDKGNDEIKKTLAEGLKMQGEGIEKASDGLGMIGLIPKALGVAISGMGEMISAAMVDQDDLAAPINLDDSGTKEAVKEVAEKVAESTKKADATTKESTKAQIAVAAKAAKEQKDATEKAGTKTKAAVVSAATTQAASVVAGATAGVQATGKAEQTFAEKLTKSRSTLSSMLKAIKEDLGGKGTDDKLNAAGGEIQKIISMEAKIRKAQNRSGIAGSGAGIKDLDRIWAGGMPKELQELGKLTAERRKIKEKEAQGREAEQGEKEHTERVKRTAISTGRAVIETSKEGAGIATSTPLSAVSDSVTGSSSTMDSRVDSRNSRTREDIEKAAFAAKAGAGPQTAAAQMDGNGRTSSLETRSEVMDRLRAETAKAKESERFLGNDEARARSEKFGEDKESFSVDALSGVVSKIVETPFGKMTQVLEGKEADAALTSMGFSPATTTGAESLEMSTSVTGAEQAKSGQEAVVAPGVQAKAEPNQQVTSMSTATNESLSTKQQGIASTSESSAFKATTDMATVGGGGGSGVSELPVMKVEGTMKVEFNQGIFNSAIATVVGRVINTPEIYKSLQKAGFVNINS